MWLAVAGKGDPLVVAVILNSHELGPVDPRSRRAWRKIRDGRLTLDAAAHVLWQPRV